MSGFKAECGYMVNILYRMVPFWLALNLVCTEFVVLLDNRFASQDQTAQQDQYHALRVLLVMTVPLHLGMSPCVHLEPILIMEKEFAVHVPVARCAQILHSNRRYISLCSMIYLISPCHYTNAGHLQHHQKVMSSLIAVSDVYVKGV